MARQIFFTTVYWKSNQALVQTIVPLRMGEVERANCARSRVEIAAHVERADKLVKLSTSQLEKAKARWPAGSKVKIVFFNGLLGQ
jgi:hypothetical protein